MGEPEGTASLLATEGHRVVAAEVRRAADLPHGDASFDTVLLGEFLLQRVALERPLAEAWRVLRPGGRLIVAMPYVAGDGEEPGPPLVTLLDELADFAVAEVAIVDERICLLARRARGRGRVAAWRQALVVAERRLAEREAEAAAQAEKVDEMKARCEVGERALIDARARVEGLEVALAAKAHERDREREAARRAGDGIVVLEQRLAESRARLDELRGIRDELERRGTQLETTLELRTAELKRMGDRARADERKLTTTEARLEKAQQRAARFEQSLKAIRGGRGYRLLRILWRLRRPLARTSRVATVEGASEGVPGRSSRRRRSRPRTSKRRPRSRPAEGPLRIAAILDEMSTACFAPECELVPLALAGWREQLDEQPPDLLLVESAWNGNDGEWQYRIARYPRKDLVGLPALRALIQGCRERGIPTVFWNKEDPVHFERFVEAASLFDHVFTSDARCVDRYRALPGERTVAPLPFAAQPRIHNPIAPAAERSTSPCFAGAWYRDRHPERRRALEALLDAARPYGLVIYDRRFDADDAAFGFPERFAPHILGSLPYERVLDAYRGHRVFLNANSVADSQTMCSRRVFELAACDAAILSTPSAALAAHFGENVIAEAGDEPSAGEALERLLGDAAERSRRTRAARRIVFAEHTYAERLARIAATAGLDCSSLRRPPFAAIDPPAGGNGAVADRDRYPWLLALQPGLGLSETALADLAAAATFAQDADVIGADPGGGGAPAVEHRYVDDLDPRALLLRRELVESRGRPDGTAEQVRAQLRRWSGQGVRLYAADADLISGRDSRPLAAGRR